MVSPAHSVFEIFQHLPEGKVKTFYFKHYLISFNIKAVFTCGTFVWDFLRTYESGASVVTSVLRECPSIFIVKTLKTEILRGSLAYPSLSLEQDVLCEEGVVENFSLRCLRQKRGIASSDLGPYISVWVCPLKMLHREQRLAVYLDSFCQDFQGSWMKICSFVILNLMPLVSHGQIFLILLHLSFRA